MRTLLILAAGIWVGRRISTIQTENRNIERELILRKRLAELMTKHLPPLSEEETQKRINTFFK